MNGKPLNIAHRGASAYAPENTFAAFDLAIVLGADALELDVHMTSDGELIAFHDDIPSRTVRTPGQMPESRINETTWEAISMLDAGSWFNDFLPAYARPEYEELRVPRLGDVFARYGSNIHYFIELKHPHRPVDMEGKLLALMNEHELFTHHRNRPCVFIESFSQKSLQKIHDMDERIAVVQLFGAYATSKAIRSYLGALPSYSVGIGPCAASVDPALAAQAARLHLVIYPWTVNDPIQMTEMLAMNADGIVSDFPDVLDEAIRGRRPDGMKPAAGLSI